MNRWLRRPIRMLVAVIFLWSAFEKVTRAQGGPTIYDAWTTSYPVLKFLVPAIEFAVAGWLVSGWRIAIPSFAAIFMLSAFTGILVAEWKKPHPKPCGCGGTLAALYDPDVIRRDLSFGIARNALMVAGLAGLLLFSKAKTDPTADYNAELSSAA